MANENGRFELPLRTCTLKFEDEYEGATVDCVLDVPLGLAFDLDRAFRSGDTEKAEQAMRDFGARVFVGTNVNVRGEKVEGDANGFMSLPPAFVRAVFDAWLQAVKDPSESPLVEKAAGS